MNGLSEIPAAALEAAVGRTALDQYVIWTGARPNVRTGSHRARILACVDQPWTPLSLRALVQRCARLDGSRGLPDDLVRSAVRQHQSAKPASVLLVERQPDGRFVLLMDVPYPACSSSPLKCGQVIDLDGQARRAA